MRDIALLTSGALVALTLLGFIYWTTGDRRPRLVAGATFRDAYGATWKVVELARPRHQPVRVTLELVPPDHTRTVVVPGRVIRGGGKRS